jgi:CDP-paratose 2-epimerase
MKVFVTGGLGVIGSSFCKTLLQDSNNITVLDACEEPRNEWMASELSLMGVKIRKERMETADLSEALDCDMILHAAAFTGIPFSSQRPDDDWLSNVEATRNLLNTLRLSNKRPNTVILSSVKPYDLSGHECTLEGTRYSWGEGVAVDEKWPLDPDEPYAASKMSQSAISVAYAKTYDLPLIVFRCSNLYGAAPCHGPRHGWLTWLCISAALGVPITIQGDGFQCRDMLYADDVTSAVFAANDSMSKIKGNLFNLGGGPRNVISVAEAAAILHEMSGVKILQGPSRKFEDLVFITNVNKFISSTSWTPGVGTVDGIKKIYTWAVQNADTLRNLYAGSI